jgi:hypothetical protein
VTVRKYRVYFRPNRTARAPRAKPRQFTIEVTVALKMLSRLDEIEDDLLIRRRRAEHEGWLGEVEGIDLTLAFLRQNARRRSDSLASCPSTWASPASLRRTRFEV